MQQLPLVRRPLLFSLQRRETMAIPVVLSGRVSGKPRRRLTKHKVRAI